MIENYVKALQRAFLHESVLPGKIARGQRRLPICLLVGPSGTGKTALRDGLIKRVNALHAQAGIITLNKQVDSATGELTRDVPSFGGLVKMPWRTTKPRPEYGYSFEFGREHSHFAGQNEEERYLSFLAKKEAHSFADVYHPPDLGFNYFLDRRLLERSWNRVLVINKAVEYSHPHQVLPLIPDDSYVFTLGLKPTDYDDLRWRIASRNEQPEAARRKLEALDIEIASMNELESQFNHLLINPNPSVSREELKQFPEEGLDVLRKSILRGTLIVMAHLYNWALGGTNTPFQQGSHDVVRRFVLDNLFELFPSSDGLATPRSSFDLSSLVGSQLTPSSDILEVVRVRFPGGSEQTLHESMKLTVENVTSTPHGMDISITQVPGLPGSDRRLLIGYSALEIGFHDATDEGMGDASSSRTRSVAFGQRPEDFRLQFISGPKPGSSEAIFAEQQGFWYDFYETYVRRRKPYHTKRLPKKVSQDFFTHLQHLAKAIIASKIAPFAIRGENWYAAKPPGASDSRNDTWYTPIGHDRPEAATSASLLLQAYKITGDSSYLAASAEVLLAIARQRKIFAEKPRYFAYTALGDLDEVIDVLLTVPTHKRRLRTVLAWRTETIDSLVHQAKLAENTDHYSVQHPCWEDSKTFVAYGAERIMNLLVREYERTHSSDVLRAMHWYAREIQTYLVREDGTVAEAIDFDPSSDAPCEVIKGGHESSSDGKSHVMRIQVGVATALQRYFNAVPEAFHRQSLFYDFGRRVADLCFTQTSVGFKTPADTCYYPETGRFIGDTIARTKIAAELIPSLSGFPRHQLYGQLYIAACIGEGLLDVREGSAPFLYGCGFNLRHQHYLGSAMPEAENAFLRYVAQHIK